MSTTIDQFIEEQRYHGKSGRTIDAYERVLADFADFLTDPDRGPRTTTPSDANRRDCMAWVHTLRGTYAESTIATYASYINRFYGYMVQIGELDANPMAIVTEEMNESIDKDPPRRDITLEDMQSFVQSITHPLEQALVGTLVKTGIRVGELCNLDRRDLAVTEGDTHARPQIADRGPALYIAPSGSIPVDRRAANKRKRATIIPVDGELQSILCRWLGIRPDPYGENPLFVSTADDWGKRLRTDRVRQIVRRHATPRGWHRAGAGAGENVTPHYFRHFFTTHMRNRTGDTGVVKYLRGDVAGDIVDTYTHNWGNRVREVYLENIYSIS